MKRYLVIALLALGSSAFAHEGAHGPEQKVAPHGGVMRDSASLMLELVKDGNTVKIYPLTHDGKPIDAKAIEIDSKKTSLTDAKKKVVPYTLVPEGNALLVKFEKGASHRYAFNLVTNFEGKENKASWQIELGAE
jgi:hypothetical protein